MTQTHSFSDRLTVLMDAKGLNHYAASKLIGYEPGVIRNWMRGRNYPNYRAIIDLADFFGVTADALLGRVPLDVPARPEATCPA